MQVFLDLDGTLTDPKEGITLSVAYAMEKLGKPVSDPEELAWVIGPPLRPTFASMGLDPEEALRLYRERYTDKGLFENRLYSGIIECLEAIRIDGHIMHLMTAKPHAYARKITAHFGLAKFMINEFGPELDGTRDNKADLLAYALRLTGIAASESIMVGDRSHDFDAAHRVGMRAVGVTWGYGSAEELSKADYICHKPSELAELVRKLSA